MRVAVIGYGAIGAALADQLAQDPRLADVALTVLTRPGRQTPHATVHDTVGLIAKRPDLAIECAGHSAVAQLVPDMLSAGIDTVVASIGALADAALHDRLRRAAEAGGARLILPAGAIGGVDMLAALGPAGIETVLYEGRKPPAAWAGSAAEAACDLAALQGATVFFEGSAREAALAYPKNANVAATLALAGIGFDATRVRLIADPAATGNHHSYTVRSGGADLSVAIAGRPSPGNLRTSMATVLSLVREIRNRAGPVAI